MRRLVLILADGLRPYAVSPGLMPSLDALGGAFTLAHHARTVRPSATVAGLAAWTRDTVFIVTADHGGGGVTATEHHEPHPTNDRIPLIVAGPGVTRRHQLTRPISLLDLPPTILWWFGLPVPAQYEGRPLMEAFARVPGPVTAAA